MMNTDKAALNKTAWITWEVQARNRSMSALLGIPLFELTSRKSRLTKYFGLIFKTITIIKRHRLRTIFVQNPSIVLSSLAICLKSILNLTVIIDAHNSGIYPSLGRSIILNAMAKYVSLKSDCVIVSNSYLADVVTMWGGKPFVMPDPIPDLKPVANRSAISERPYVFFICTWTDDEPYWEVIKAAALIEKDIDIYITGNYPKCFIKPNVFRLPKNVKLLGFISEEDYINYFANAAVALDLTTRDNCLVCGAYEAIALGVPAIVSESRVNRETFHKGFVYTTNDALSIGRAILSCLRHHDILYKGIRELKNEHNNIVVDRAKHLRHMFFGKNNAN